MKKISGLIIILVIIIIIIIFAIAMLAEQGNVKEKDSIIEIEETDELTERNLELHIETNRNRFYIVKNCVEKFYECYQNLNPENIVTKLYDEEINFEDIEKENEEKIYAMLDKEYINYKNIESTNIKETLGKIGKVQVYVDRIYTRDLDNSSYICFVEGRTKEDGEDIKNYKMIVKLSGSNNFKIFLDDYLQKNNYYDFTQNIDITPLCKFEITDEKYNTYKSKAISTSDYVTDLYMHYKNCVMKDKEFAYELIEEKYRSIRFEKKEEYIAYVKENYSKIVSTVLESYNQSTIDGINQYLCKDNYGKYYIFKETAPFQYTVILDNYTIPTEEFSKEYNSSSEAEKVILNIKRFFMGIDDKNYGYSYSVLSEGFKDNKYPTKTEFINYAKKNFFKENKIEYISYEKENGVYIYKIKITDATGKSTEEKEFNIILKLNEGTNFEMSFGAN